MDATRIKPAAVLGNIYQSSGENTSSSKLKSCLGVAAHEPQKNLAVNNQQTNADGIAKNFQMHDTPLHNRSLIIATAKEFINTLAQECSNFVHDLLGNGDYLHGAYHYTDADIPYESYRKYNQEVTEFIQKVGTEIESYYSAENNDTYNSKKINLPSLGNYINVFVGLKLDFILQNEKALKELFNQSQIENTEAIRNKFMQFIKQDHVCKFIEEYCSDSCKKIAKEIRDVDLSNLEQIDNIHSLIKKEGKYT